VDEKGTSEAVNAIVRDPDWAHTFALECDLIFYAKLFLDGVPALDIVCVSMGVGK
jgi:hypothetical protein